MHIKNLILNLLVVVGLCACNQSNSGGGTTSSNNSNSPGSGALQTKNNCTNPKALECQPGVKFVKTADELRDEGLRLEDIKQQKDSAQFSNNHFAILVAPGTYNMIKDGQPRAFNLGYNTQVLGVGKTMDEVVINPGVEAYNNPDSDLVNCFTDSQNPLCEQPGGLNNFWRGIENFKVERPNTPGPLLFAVSQAAPIRNVHFTSGILLCDWHAPRDQCGYTSGGFMANSILDQAFIPGSQQQWVARNSNFGATPDTAVWNSVFVGAASPGIPLGKNPDELALNNWNNYPVTFNPTEAVSGKKTREKPFLVCAGDCKNEALGSIKWKVEIPKVRTDLSGIDDFKGVNTPTELDVDSNFIILSVDIEGVVKTLDATAIANINTELASGKNLIITPGVYNLDAPINIARNNTIVLGLGIPSLVCNNPTGCINVSATAGVDLAGITLDAGYNKTPSLLQVGPVGHTSSEGSADNPIFLHDVYFRIAETQLKNPAQERQTVAAAIINTSHVVGDNLWVWRADHDFRATKLVKWTEDLAQYGLIVYGDNVTMNGLAVEHFQDYQTVWYGKNGTVNFYQSEMPYDVSELEDWKCHDPKTGILSPVRGCASYVVDSSATGHRANGLGVYTYFRDAPIFARSGYIVPEDLKASNIVLHHLMGKYLNGNRDSGFKHLVATPLGDKCQGDGVHYRKDDIVDIKFQYSIWGEINNNLPECIKK